MTTAFAARASRQPLILAGVISLHVGALVIMALGMKVPSLPEWRTGPIHVIDQPPPPASEAGPRAHEPAGYELGLAPVPPIAIPDFEDATPASGARGTIDPASGSGPTLPVAVELAPGLRTRDRRLAALIDACYPAALRRLREDGAHDRTRRRAASISFPDGATAARWRLRSCCRSSSG